MLKLYYAPDNASLILRLALEEAGLPYQTALVDRASRAQKSPEYLALNPAGLIPTLITPQGPISETGACLLWLCEACPEANLCPRAGDADRGLFLRWLFYIANTLHADLIHVFYPERFVPAEAVADYYAFMTNRVKQHFAILEAACSDQRGIFAPGAALSCYLCPLIRWSALYPVSGERWFVSGDYPNLRGLAVAAEMRDSAKAAAKAEGLGPTPFSDPRLPAPPEGSAT